MQLQRSISNHVIYNQINLSFVTINENFHLISVIPIAILLQVSKSVCCRCLNILIRYQSFDKHRNIHRSIVTSSRKAIMWRARFHYLKVIERIHYIWRKCLVYICWDNVHFWNGWSNKMQMKLIWEQRIFDNTLCFKLCIWLHVICVAITSLVSLLRRLKYNRLSMLYSILRIDGAAVTSFVAAHVPPNQHELFDGLIQTLSLFKWLISEHEVKLVP